MTKKIFSESDHLRIAVGSARWGVISTIMAAFGGVFFSSGFTMMVTFTTFFSASPDIDTSNIQAVLLMVEITMMGGGMAILAGSFLISERKFSEFEENLTFLESFKGRVKSDDQDTPSP